MAISINSVVHYTNFENLKSIISEQAFHIKYCLEKVNGIDSAFPMVCFCDIPYDQVTEHRGKYGDYSIGLSKDWAKTKGINPVLYFNEDSYLEKLFRDQGAKLDVDMRSGNSDSRYWLDSFISVLSFVKRVEGTIKKNGMEEYVKFYDEREWRYVPTRQELSILEEKIGFIPNVQIYGPTYQHNKDAINRHIADFRLHFEISDISEILVFRREEIDELIDHIKNLGTFSLREIESLSLKTTQI